MKDAISSMNSTGSSNGQKRPCSSPTSEEEEKKQDYGRPNTVEEAMEVDDDDDSRHHPVIHEPEAKRLKRLTISDEKDEDSPHNHREDVMMMDVDMTVVEPETNDVNEPEDNDNESTPPHHHHQVIPPAVPVTLNHNSDANALSAAELLASLHLKRLVPAVTAVNHHDNIPPGSRSVSPTLPPQDGGRTPPLLPKNKNGSSVQTTGEPNAPNRVILVPQTKVVSLSATTNTDTDTATVRQPPPTETSCLDVHPSGQLENDPKQSGMGGRRGRMWVAYGLKLLLVCGMGRLLFEGLLQWTHEGPHHMAGRPMIGSSAWQGTVWMRSLFVRRSDNDSNVTSRQRQPPTSPRVPSNLTLREFLLHPDGFHLAMGPAFFGYFAYFGALITLDEAVGVLHDDSHNSNDNGSHDNPIHNEDGDDVRMKRETMLLQSVAGASAGAMAAVLLSAGIPPRRAAEFASRFSLSDFADPPALLGVLRGDKFESIMHNFIWDEQLQLRTKELERKQQQQQQRSPFENPALLQTNGTQTNHSNHNEHDNHQNHPSNNEDEDDDNWKPRLALQDGLIPVAVSGFDLWTMRVKLLSQGSMARAARSSACFPGLFQPVSWWDNDNDNDTSNHDTHGNGTSSTTAHDAKEWPLDDTSEQTKKRRSRIPDSFLIDGGVVDVFGLQGLSVLLPHVTQKRIVNMVVGDFGPLSGPPGPSRMPEHGLLDTSAVVSIAITNTPRCAPWAMANGPLAVEAARLALQSVLDQPMYHGNEKNHYIVHADAAAAIAIHPPSCHT